MTTVDDILAHHGVKGMKWGVRRSDRGKSSSPKHAPSSDAQSAHDFQRIAKASGTHALSNKELQHLVNRMNLEQQYSRLNRQKSNAAAKFARELLVNVGKQQASKLAADVVSKQIGVALKK